MQQAIIFTYLYHDQDVVEVRVTAWNGSFGGSADVYVGHGELEQFASVISGFPESSTDSREITLGAFGPGFAGGAAQFRFFCRDRAGHSAVLIKIESDDQINRQAETAEFVGDFEPAALDAFVSELILLSKNLGGSSTLKF